GGVAVAGGVEVAAPGQVDRAAGPDLVGGLPAPFGEQPADGQGDPVGGDRELGGVEEGDALPPPEATQAPQEPGPGLPGGVALAQGPVDVGAALRPGREAAHLLLGPGGEEHVELAGGAVPHRGLGGVVGELEEGGDGERQVAGALLLVPAVPVVGG